MYICMYISFFSLALSRGLMCHMHHTLHTPHIAPSIQSQLYNLICNLNGRKALKFSQTVRGQGRSGCMHMVMMSRLSCSRCFSMQAASSYKVHGGRSLFCIIHIIQFIVLLCACVCIRFCLNIYDIYINRVCYIYYIGSVW